MVRVELSERLRSAISTIELERRWTAIRRRMETAGIDVFVVQANNDFYGGYVRYLLDVAATRGRPTTIVFPRDRPMTIVRHGEIGVERSVSEGDDSILRGVERELTTAAFPSVHFTSEWEGELATAVLGPYAGATIGLVGAQQMSYTTVESLKRSLPRAQFVDASDLVDAVKAVKSPEEIAFLRATADAQDRALARVAEAIEPGMTDHDAALASRAPSGEPGIEQGFVLCASAPLGAPADYADTHLQGRVLQPSDIFTITIENSGPGGLWAEIGRTFVLGDAPEEVLEEHDFVMRARGHCLDMLRPGALPADIWESYNEFMRDNGRPQERRLHCHGQGYDIIERPLVRFDETMNIASGMTLACHPHYVGNVAIATISDVFLIGTAGPERLHRTPESVIEVDRRSIDRLRI